MGKILRFIDFPVSGQFLPLRRETSESTPTSWSDHAIYQKEKLGVVKGEKRLTPE
jgi:hypothetical protein